MAQRALACTACHGKEGRAASEGYFPRIAGKPAGYLYNQLLNFRDGRRNNATMTHLVQHLSDAYLREMAGYFAQLDLPYPPPQPAACDAATLERGRTLVLRRRRRRAAFRPAPQCHGAALTGVAPAIPGLLGLPRDYLNAQFGAWLTGQRKALPPDCMAQVARQLHPDDISALPAGLPRSRCRRVRSRPRALPAPMPLRLRRRARHCGRQVNRSR